MEYDAVGLSTRDLRAGRDFFSQQEIKQVPFVSSNILTKEHKPAFAPFLIKDTNSNKIAIIGLTGGKDKLDDFIISDWRSALQKQLSVVSKRADFLLLLSSLTLEENRKLCEMFPEIDAIISTIISRGNITEIINNNTLLTQVSPKGKILGQLEITWSPTTLNGWQKPQKNRELDSQETGNIFTASFQKVSPKSGSEQINQLVKEIAAKKKL